MYYKKTRECQEIQRRQREDQETSKVEEPIIGEDRVEMGQNLLDLKILDFKKLPPLLIVYKPEHFHVEIFSGARILSDTQLNL